MPSAGLEAGSNKVDVAIDLGNPLLNRTVDGFLKIGAVGACRVVAEDAFDCIHRGNHNASRLSYSSIETVLLATGSGFICVDTNVTPNYLGFFAGDISKRQLEETLKKMCKEGAYWGAVAGVYVGMEYGVERARGDRDWKNALIGGIATGALVSAATNNKGNKIAQDAITGGAIATAVEFINYLT
ncbi:hypothetical protein TRIUR3_34729 [Triticum urartu]|uniref:Outer envelope pore protein 16, chloroplastic n=2 Tax=Triticinae TaxID=1648030 RepID=M7YSB4_TRIUA|nr:hypothetical protein TRIUR3_34729 [Triticum urartu]